MAKNGSKADTEAAELTVKDRYITWLATPEKERLEPTQQVFSDVWGISDRTLRRWQKEPAVLRQVSQLALEGLAPHLADIYAVLARKAKRGELAHAKLVLQLLGILGGSGEPQKPLFNPAGGKGWDFDLDLD